MIVRGGLQQSLGEVLAVFVLILASASSLNRHSDPPEDSRTFSWLHPNGKGWQIRFVFHLVHAKLESFPKIPWILPVLQLRVLATELLTCSIHSTSPSPSTSREVDYNKTSHRDGITHSLRRHRLRARLEHRCCIRFHLGPCGCGKCSPANSAQKSS